MIPCNIKDDCKINDLIITESIIGKRVEKILEINIQSYMCHTIYNLDSNERYNNIMIYNYKDNYKVYKIDESYLYTLII